AGGGGGGDGAGGEARYRPARPADQLCRPRARDGRDRRVTPEPSAAHPDRPGRRGQDPSRAAGGWIRRRRSPRRCAPGRPRCRCLRRPGRRHAGAGTRHQPPADPTRAGKPPRLTLELQGLLLVDNCEHVVAETAALLSDLLTAGGPLRVLATSREVLGVPGEVSYEVQPLPVPSGQASSRAATAGGYDAVRLFADRATHASPGFTLTDANASAVAALCQRLDGLPLAIELAASRVRSFPPATLLELLDQRFELLTTGARTALPRHRTL